MPCSMPEYRNGRAMNASVAPNNFCTSISCRRLCTAMRMVLPTTRSTAPANRAAAISTPRWNTSMIWCKRCAHCQSYWPKSTSGSDRSSDSNVPSPAARAATDCGRTTTTNGNGFRSRASSAPANPEFRLYSARACSGLITSTSIMSARARSPSASAMTRSSSTSGARNRDRWEATSRWEVTRCAFSSNA